MWVLDIKCIALIASCVLNPDPAPPVKREFQTRIECDRALIVAAKDWKPAYGAWTMNCVQQRGFKQ